MHRTVRFVFWWKMGLILWRVLNLIAGLVLLSAVGHVLMGRYLFASVLVAGVVGLYGLVWRVLTPRRRA